MPNRKETVYVYCADVAKEILRDESNIELNCVLMTQRVCSTPEEIDKFYGVAPALKHECPSCCGSGYIDETKMMVCPNCTNYAVNKTREQL